MLSFEWAPKPALFSAPIGVVVGGDSGQAGQGEHLQLSPRRCGDNNNTDIIINVQTVLIFINQNNL